MRKEAVMVHFKVLSRNLAERAEQYGVKPKNSWCRGRVSNRKPHEFKSEAIEFAPVRLEVLS
jgi:hypothetical protein